MQDSLGSLILFY